MRKPPFESPGPPAPLTPAGYHKALTDGSPVPEGEITEIPMSDRPFLFSRSNTIKGAITPR